MQIRLFRSGLCVASALFAFMQLGAPTRATGITRIQQSNGTTQVYNDSHVRLAGHTLWITSTDRRDTLEVHNAACSYVGEVKRCLPYSVTLHRAGHTHAIVLDHGTVYLNLTGTDQPMPFSSKHIAANGLVFVMKTARGTFVSVRGTFDEVTK